MFEDWKNAWQEAVDNFHRELDGEEGPAHLSAMRRDLNAARKALDQLQLDEQRTRTELAEEEKQEETCRRRADMATAIKDEETVRIAQQWAERHHQRAGILRQKAEVLGAELAMRNDDFKGMEEQFEKARATLAAPPPPPPERQKVDSDFRRLDRDAREKAAEARLEELKKKRMSG